MSSQSFSERLPYNVPGKFYVDEQCLDCDLCRETAPTLFSRNEEEGVSYIFKQPETEEEQAQAQESLEGCPCEAIFSDGDEHDWSIPPNPERPKWREGEAAKPNCSHCGGADSDDIRRQHRNRSRIIFVALYLLTLVGTHLHFFFGIGPPKAPDSPSIFGAALGLLFLFVLGRLMIIAFFRGR